MIEVATLRLGQRSFKFCRLVPALLMVKPGVSERGQHGQSGLFSR